MLGLASHMALLKAIMVVFQVLGIEGAHSEGLLSESTFMA